MQKQSEKIIIGRLETIDLPDLSLFSLDAKIDTGAYTSSLHCHKIVTYSKEGDLWVRFHVLDPEHPEYKKKQYESLVLNSKNVKSSNGTIEHRVIINQKAKFCGKERKIELSLTDRSSMKYPVLIGRKFLSDKYLIDISKTFLNNW